MTRTSPSAQRILRGSLVAALALAAPLIAVVGVAASAADTTDSAATASSSPTLKPGLEGLVVTQPDSIKTVPYATFASVKLPWNTIETAPGSYDFSYVDKVLREHPAMKRSRNFWAGWSRSTLST